MFLVSSCSCLCPIQWSQVLSREWRCSWSSADRRCSNYIWVIDNFIAYIGATYIRDFTVVNVQYEEGRHYTAEYEAYLLTSNYPTKNKSNWNSLQHTTSSFAYRNKSCQLMAWDPTSVKPQTFNINLMACAQTGARPIPNPIIQWPEHD